MVVSIGHSRRRLDHVSVLLVLAAVSALVVAIAILLLGHCTRVGYGYTSWVHFPCFTQSITLCFVAKQRSVRHPPLTHSHSMDVTMSEV